MYYERRCVVCVVCFWVWTSALRGVRGEDERLLCNSNTVLGKALIEEAKRRHPVTIPHECTKRGMEEEMAAYVISQAACTALIGSAYSIVTIPAIVACFDEVEKAHAAHLDRCDKVWRRVRDEAAGLNIRVPAFTGTIAEYVLALDPALGAFHTTDGQTLLWTGFGLRAEGHEAGCVGAGCDEWMMVPNVPTGVRLTLTPKSLTMPGEATLAPDLLIDAKSAQTRLVRTVVSGASTAAWSVRVRGCAPPNVTVRVEWASAFTTVQGESAPKPYLFDPNSGAPPKVACWSRKLTVTRMVETPMTSEGAMRCHMAVSLNEVRARLKGDEAKKAEVRAYLQTLTWAKPRVQTRASVLYSEAMANALIQCAQPSDGGIGGTWKRFVVGTFGEGGEWGAPGVCVPCETEDRSQPSLRARNLRVRACDRSLPQERLLDCCTECRVGFMRPTPSALACVPTCRPGTQYVAGVCLACSYGMWSPGALAPCVPCGANTYVGRTGCVSCGARAYVFSGGRCENCPSGKFVPAGRETCDVCPTSEGLYLPQAGTACEACPAGTYIDPAAGDCALCPTQTWSALPAATACAACATGMRSTANRTVCVACPSIDRGRLPFSEYYAPGCALRCEPGRSYLRTSALLRDGCGDCRNVSVPLGHFVPNPLVSCVKTAPCTNRPVGASSVYTGPSPTQGVSLCPWACVPGFLLDGSACAACDASGFDALKHRWLYGCTRGCQPRRYVHDATCSQPCTNLLTEFNAGTLPLRASELRRLRPDEAQWPWYQHHVCGTSDTLPQASLPALRRGMWAYALPKSEALSKPARFFCGDAFLNAGEACDDGNAVSNDGCSSACTVETDRYWDCDLVGAPCLPNCGWPSSGGGSPWGMRLSAYGYVLPACTVCHCDALRYSEVQALPSLANRTAWIRDTLVPCDCYGNPHRTLPYAECTAANRGCRACAAGQYHYDQYERCVPCGSQCAAGYVRAAPMTVACGPLVTTSALVGKSEAERQQAIGCVPCPGLGEAGVRFLGNGTCAKACVRSAALLTGSYTSDLYCERAVDASTGACDGRCLSCAARLNDMVDAVPTAGKYPQGCVDAVGYRWMDCEGLPPNAHWTRGATQPNAARGCEWECDACTWSASKTSACTACGRKGRVPCASGSRLLSCDQMGCPSSVEYEVCVPCEGPLPGAMQVWTSAPPYNGPCVPDCEPGLSFSAQVGDKCQACTRMACGLGTALSPCVPRADTECRNCTLRPAHTEFVAAGVCETRCVAGYYMHAQTGVCVACSTVECAVGSRRAHACVSVEERLQMPTCVACDPPPQGMRWQQDCAFFVCLDGFVSAGNGTCVPCTPTMCGLGQQGACVGTQLLCAPCPRAPSPGARWAVAGECASEVCLEGHTLEAEGCVAVSGPIAPMNTPAPVVASPKRGRTTAGLPARSLRHS